MSSAAQFFPNTILLTHEEETFSIDGFAQVEIDLDLLRAEAFLKQRQDILERSQQQSSTAWRFF